MDYDQEAVRLLAIGMPAIIRSAIQFCPSDSEHLMETPDEKRWRSLSRKELARCLFATRTPNRDQQNIAQDAVRLAVSNGKVLRRVISNKTWYALPR